ncbi:hypothetical protein B0H19DRAFT_1145834 [Mycena capillaripes]|nr:hypothetical protein B0H19DRAFT_1145834 [Mycena capillaripes]
MVPEPVLPLDLEREIFEFTALLYPAKLPTLLRVCRRVHSWLEPLLFRVLRLDKPIPMCVIRSVLEPQAYALPSRCTWAQRLLSKITRKPLVLEATDVEPLPPSRTVFLQSTIRGIVLPMQLRVDSNDWQRLNRILLLNPSIFELSIRRYSFAASDSLQPLPPQMRPTRLTLQFSYYNGAIIDLKAPLFSCVTHLTLLGTAGNANYAETWGRWQALPALPALTHLCVLPDIGHVIVSQVLTACLRLEALVVLWLTAPSVTYQSTVPSGIAAPAHIRVQMEAFADEVHVAADARVVLVSESNFDNAWERGVKSGYDMWVRVSQFITRKRRGEIEASKYLLDDAAPAA